MLVFFLFLFCVPIGHAGSYKYDISLPLAGMYGLVEAVRERVTDEVGVMGYGHIGDGNIHLNVVTPEVRRWRVEVVCV